MSAGEVAAEEEVVLVVAGVHMKGSASMEWVRNSPMARKTVQASQNSSACRTTDGS